MRATPLAAASAGWLDGSSTLSAELAASPRWGHLETLAEEQLAAAGVAQVQVATHEERIYPIRLVGRVPRRWRPAGPHGAGAPRDEPPHLLLSASGAAGNCCQRCWHHRHRSKSRPVCWLPVCVRLLPAALPGRLPCAAATRLRPTPRHAAPGPVRTSPTLAPILARVNLASYTADVTEHSCTQNFGRRGLRSQ